MTKRTLCKIEKVRKGLIKEISKQAINLNKKNLHYKGIIPLDFSYDDVCKYCPSLENYQYIKVEKSYVSLVYIDKNFKVGYENSSKKEKIETDELWMFSMDELFHICKFLGEIMERL
ncbi:MULTISPECIES: hypothetical protein [Treponema]|uniref:hypothetical protein n=1 Tax=Treponema TaxID=157 RepID=UPI00235351F7|nr:MULTISPECIES: hypothetical protein [Treponema]MBQ9101477.1 hypothetical protein [Treponema sp.]MCI5541383.1 hypothetical protein [Treponema berlinense]MDD5835068.1 hypothetical protein [Treponema berlinense]MDY3708330.1 hypothetical protein [Treponema berlinense]